MSLENIYEFAIKIPKKDRWSCIQTLRSKVQPAIKILKQNEVQWYCFLVHGNQNGVPIPNYDGYQYHIRFELETRMERELFEENLKRILPDYCIGLRKSVPLEKINGLDETLYSTENTETGWILLYLQCDWVYRFLVLHKKLTLRQIFQFMHFFDNIFARECMIEPRKKIMEKLIRWFTAEKSQEAKGNTAYWCNNCNAIVFQNPEWGIQCNICTNDVNEIK